MQGRVAFSSARTARTLGDCDHDVLQVCLAGEKAIKLLIELKARWSTR